MDNPDDDIADAVNYPEVRTFMTAREISTQPEYDLPGIIRNWVVPTDSKFHYGIYKLHTT